MGADSARAIVELLDEAIATVNGATALLAREPAVARPGPVQPSPRPLARTIPRETLDSFAGIWLVEGQVVYTREDDGTISVWSVERKGAKLVLMPRER